MPGSTLRAHGRHRTLSYLLGARAKKLLRRSGLSPSRTADGAEHVCRLVVVWRDAQAVEEHEPEEQKEDDRKQLEVADEEAGREREHRAADEPAHRVSGVEGSHELLRQEVLLRVRDGDEH